MEPPQSNQGILENTPDQAPQQSIVTEGPSQKFQEAPRLIDQQKSPATGTEEAAGYKRQKVAEKGQHLVNIGGNNRSEGLSNPDKRVKTRFQIVNGGDSKHQEGNPNFSIWSDGTDQSKQPSLANNSAKRDKPSDSREETEERKQGAPELHEQSLLAQFGFRYIMEAKLSQDKRLKSVLKKQKKDKKKRKHKKKLSRSRSSSLSSRRSASSVRDQNNFDKHWSELKLLGLKDQLDIGDTKSKKKKDKKKHKKGKRGKKRSRSRSADSKPKESESESEGDIGPKIPEFFYEEIAIKEELEEEAEQQRKELTQSYRRPRRQRVPDVVHPQDERKQIAQASFKESQRREAIVRAEMQRLLEESKKKKRQSQV